MFKFYQDMDKSYNLYMFCKKTGENKEQAEKEYYIWKEQYLKSRVVVNKPKSRKPSKEYKQKMVRRLDNGTIYFSAKEAALKTNSNADCIRSCCNGTTKHYKGVVWQYIN